MVEIVRGIPAELAQQAAEIYYEAFRQKLTPFLGTDQEQAIAIMTAHLRLDNAFAAVRDGRLLGLVGFHYAGEQFFDLGPRPLIEQFGVFGGAWRIVLGALLLRQPARGELLMDGIAVHSAARGQGVGTRLFDALFAFGIEHGYTRIRLKVIDTNPRARQLYERLGFVEMRTDSVPFLRFMGFSAVTTMTCDLSGRK